MIRTAPLLLAFSVAIMPSVNAAHASDFGPYTFISHEVSVSYAQIQRGLWTWKFLNNSSTTTIIYMAFKYKDKDGEHNGTLRQKLKPGASVGGPSDFTASSRPTITITEIKRSAK